MPVVHPISNSVTKKNNLSSFSNDKESFVSLVTDSGRVKVFVRVRPPRPQENSRKEPIAVNVQELSSQVC